MAVRILKAVPRWAAALCLIISSILMSSCGVVGFYDVDDRPSEQTFESISVKDVNIPRVPTAKEEKEPEYDPDDLLDELPIDNFDEMYFTVITLSGKNAIFPEETSYIASSSYERNQKVEEKYNIKLYEKAMDEPALLKYIESSDLAGEYYADLLDLPYSYMPLLYEKGLIQNFRTKPFFVEERPYFDSEVNGKLNEGYNGLYALYCDALYSPDDMCCLFYNKTLEGASELEAGGFDFAIAQKYGLVSAVALPESLRGAVTGEDTDLFRQGGALMLIDKISAIEELSAKMSFGVGGMALPLSSDPEERAYIPVSELQVFFYPTNAAFDKCTSLVASALGAAGYGENVKAAKEHYLSYVQDNAFALMLDRIFSDFYIDSSTRL